MTTYQNSLLSNLINKWHPICFYGGTGLVGLVVGKLYYCVGWVPRWSLLGFYYYYFHRLAAAGGLVYASLLAGAWWALQEGSWGGWWNWDPSEVLGLGVLLLLLRVVHLPLIGRRGWDWCNRTLAGVGFLVVMFLFVQLNFTLVIHNFGVRYFYFFTTTALLVEVCGGMWVWIVGRSYQLWAGRGNYLLAVGAAGGLGGPPIYWLLAGAMGIYLGHIFVKSLLPLFSYCFWATCIWLFRICSWGWGCYTAVWYLLLGVGVYNLYPKHWIGAIPPLVTYYQLIYLNILVVGRAIVYWIHWCLVGYYSLILIYTNSDIFGCMGGSGLGFGTLWQLVAYKQYILENITCDVEIAIIGDGGFSCGGGRVTGPAYTAGFGRYLLLTAPTTVNLILLNSFNYIQTIYITGWGIELLLGLGMGFLGSVYYYSGGRGYIN